MSRFALPAALAALAIALPASAGAETFCVHNPSGCAGTTTATVQDALDAADALPGRDTVRVGWPYGAFGSVDIVAGNAVDVVGDNGAEVWLDATHVVTVHEPSATIENVDFWVKGVGAAPPVDLAAGTLDHVTISARDADPVVRLGDATLRHVGVGLTDDRDGVGVLAVGPGGVIDHSTLWGQIGLVSSSDDLRVSHTLVTARDRADGVGVRVVSGKTTVDESLVELPIAGPSGIGVDVAPGAGQVELALSGVTIKGGGPLSTGVREACTGGGTAAVSLLDAAVFGFGVDLDRSAPGCAMDLDYVRYVTRDAHGGAFGDGAGVSAGPVGPFGVYAPMFGSALIDAGSPRPAADPDEGDVFGPPGRRVVDGDGDGVARRDIGGGEYQRRAPSAFLATTAGSVSTGEPVEFDASKTSDPDSEPVTLAWSVDGNPVTAPGDGRKLIVTFGQPGKHAAAIAVTDSAGLTSHTTQTVTVNAPAGGGHDDGGGGGQTQTTTTTTVTPPAAKPAVATVKATLISKRVSVGVLRVRVACGAAARCKGSVVLKAGKVTIGRAKFDLKAGAATTVKVKVTGKAAKRALARVKGGVAVSVAVLKSSGRGWTNGQGGKVRP